MQWEVLRRRRRRRREGKTRNRFNIREREITFGRGRGREEGGEGGRESKSKRESEKRRERESEREREREREREKCYPTQQAARLERSRRVGGAAQRRSGRLPARRCCRLAAARRAIFAAGAATITTAGSCFHNFRENSLRQTWRNIPPLDAHTRTQRADSIRGVYYAATVTRVAFASGYVRECVRHRGMLRCVQKGHQRPCCRPAP